MRHNWKNCIGERFGRLVVTEPIAKDGKVTCKCDCGNIVRVAVSALPNGRTKSCGCLKKELQKSEMYHRDYIMKAVKADKVWGTSLGKLKSGETYTNNTSGRRGVSKRKNGKFIAYIGLRGKMHYLGIFKTFNEAVLARKDAEDTMYKPIVDMAKTQGLLA